MKKYSSHSQDIEALIMKWKAQGHSMGYIFFCFFKTSILLIATLQSPLSKKMDWLEKATAGAKKILAHTHAAEENQNEMD